MKIVRVTISMPEKAFKAIEDKRGLVPRSAWIIHELNKNK